MQGQPTVYARIAVTTPILQKAPTETIAPYVTYLITGSDPHGTFEIRRRFRQFLLLRNKFVERFVGIYIPPIPSKRQAGKTDQKYVEERRRFLQYFCLKIAERPFLFDSDIFQTFLRGDPDFQRACKSIPSHEYALIANVYEVEYRRLADEANMPEIIIAIEKQAEVLKQVDKRLSGIKGEVQEVIQSKAYFIKQFNDCFLNVLSKYEDSIILAHDPNCDPQSLVSLNDKYKEALASYVHFCRGNPLADYQEQLTYDIRETRALLEAIESRRDFENRKHNYESVRRDSKSELEKLKSGRRTLKSIFTPGNKDAQIKTLEEHIPQYEQHETFLSQCLPLSAISIYRDIQRFKTLRSLDYLGGLQLVAQKQMRLLSCYGNFLQSVNGQGKVNPKKVLVVEQQHKESMMMEESESIEQ